MSEMQERVAQMIDPLIFEYRTQVIRALGFLPDKWTGIDQMDSAMQRARAIILLMRRSTPAMKDCGAMVIGDCYLIEDDCDIAGKIWEVMLDSALGKNSS